MVIAESLKVYVLIFVSLAHFVLKLLAMVLLVIKYSTLSVEKDFKLKLPCVSLPSWFYGGATGLIY